MHENDKIKSTYVKALYIMRSAIIMAVFNAIILVFLLMTMYKAAKSSYTGETSGSQIETHTGTDPEAIDKRLTRSAWFFFAAGGERAVSIYRFWDDLIDNCKNFGKLAPSAWCLYDAITTLVIYAGNGYHLYQGLTVVLANLREQGFTIGGFKRDGEFQSQIDQLESIFDAKFVMVNETHPVQLSFEQTADKMQYHASGSNRTVTHLFLEREYSSIAGTNYGDQSFSSGGIDAYLDLHPSPVEGQLDINNDWDTLREQVECAMSGRINKSNVVSFMLENLNKPSTFAAGTLATVNDDGSSPIGSSNSQPGADTIGSGNNECHPSNHDELK